MKKLLIITVILFGCFILKAQQIEKGKYYPNPENKKFEGVWIYINGLDTFKIVLESKKVYNNKIGIYTDYLQGNCMYNDNKASSAMVYLEKMNQLF
ncbi:MAG: DUF6705 family protein [Daejeonella sp.]